MQKQTPWIRKTTLAYTSKRKPQLEASNERQTHYALPQQVFAFALFKEVTVEVPKCQHGLPLFLSMDFDYPTCQLHVNEIAFHAMVLEYP